MPTLFFSGFRYWWSPLVTGLLAVAVGIMSFIWPASSLETFAILFECCLLVAGIFNVCYALGNASRQTHWGWALANGLIEVILAIWLWTMPIGELTIVFIYVVAFWLIFMCVYGIAEYATLSAMRIGWVSWLIGLLVIGLISAVLILWGPIGTGIAVWMFIGCSFIAYGVSRIVLSFRLRAFNKKNGR